MVSSRFRPLLLFGFSDLFVLSFFPSFFPTFNICLLSRAGFCSNSDVFISDFLPPPCHDLTTGGNGVPRQREAVGFFDGGWINNHGYEAALANRDRSTADKMGHHFD